MTSRRLRANFSGPQSLELDTPSGTIQLRPAGSHPLLGDVDEICLAGVPITVVGQIDWRDPRRIPPMLKPALLPPGCGTGLLNTIAESASGPVRYRGPYPTAALYHSLSTCFTPSGSVEAFTAGVEGIALRGAEVEPPVDFTPAPFARFQTGEVIVEVKDEVVGAIWFGAARFERGRSFGRTLEDRGGLAVARFIIPGAEPLEVAAARNNGEVARANSGPAPISGAHLGQPLPEQIAQLICAAAIKAAPTLLKPGLDAIRDRPIVWADTGLDLARIVGDQIAIHGQLATADLAPSELLATLVQAAAPLALRLAQRELSRLAP